MGIVFTLKIMRRL
ncbi:hypothetical protein LINPERPRIM_LOCUS14322 [Linum perenne]